MCAKSHLGCDGKRPCKRCIQRGCVNLCRDNDTTIRKKPPKRVKPDTSDDDTSDESYVEKDDNINSLSNTPLPLPVAPPVILDNSAANLSQIRTFNVPMVHIPPVKTQPTIINNVSDPPVTSNVVPPVISNVVPTVTNRANDLVSPLSINFLLDQNPEKSNTDVYNRISYMEDSIRKEMKSIREEIKQTHDQQHQILVTLTNMQKQLEGLFVAYPFTSSLQSNTENIPMAKWDIKTLRLLSFNEPFEKMLEKDTKDFNFRQIFPEFFLPIAESIINTMLMNIKEDRNFTINQVIAICPYNYAQVNYVYLRGYQDNMEFTTYFFPINPTL